MLNEKCSKNKQHLVEIETYIDDKIEVAVVANNIDNSIFLDKVLSEKLIEVREQLESKAKNISFKTPCAESDEDWLSIEPDNDSFTLRAYNSMNETENEVSLSREQVLNVINEVETLQSAI